MARSAILAFLALWLACSVTAATSSVADHEEELETIPAFLWSSHVGISGGGHSVDYQTHDAAAIGEKILASVDESLPDLVFAFVGKHLQAGDVGRLGPEEDGPLAALKGAMRSANGSRSFPHVRHGASDEPMAALLSAAYERVAGGKRPGAGQLAVVGHCGVRSPGAAFLTTLEEARDFLASRAASRAAGETDMLVVCGRSPSPSVPRLEGLSREGDAFARAYEIVRELAPKHVAVYTADPTDARRAASAARRALAQRAGGNTTLCDVACQTKATLWEVLFVAITLLITLISGLCCLVAVDTPDRFELPKDS